MPSRIIPFINNQIYHVYNRGSEKRPIFESPTNQNRFIKTLAYYQLEGPKPKLSRFLRFQGYKLDKNKKMVDILAYCLMPNHFHIVLKQLKEGGITEFVSKLSNSYTKYYNTKYNRVGPLFQGEFKAVLVETDEQLIHLSGYVHLNPLVSYLVKDLEQYPWSSYHEYMGKIKGICELELILSYFKSPEDYKEFILAQEDLGKQLEMIKHKLIDPDDY